MRSIKDYTEIIESQKDVELIHALEVYGKIYREKIKDLKLEVGFYKDSLEESNEAFELVREERDSLKESLKSEKAKAQKEIDHYKQLYLDELQKRLELADRVRELEGK